MDQNDAASEYLKRVFGGTLDGLTLEVLTGTQAAAEINLLHNRVWRDVGKPPPATTHEDEVLATQAFASLVANLQGSSGEMSNATRAALAKLLMLAMNTADRAGSAPFMAAPPGLAREHFAVAASLRALTRTGSQLPLRTDPAP